jgi:DNA-binding transcriptional LysR family regulator
MASPQINLNQLRAFFLTVREKSMTKAAEALFVTQPAVTMQIKALEESLGVKLLKKRGKLLELTDAGNLLFGYAERVFQVVDEMEHVLRRYSDMSGGSLIIGTTRSFARHLMPGLLSRFQEQFSTVKVSLEVGSSQEIADDLREFRYDLAIIGKLSYGNTLRVIDYSREEFCLVTSPIHRFAAEKTISLKQLKNEPIIIREEGSGSRYAILSLLREHGIIPSVLIEAGSVQFIKEYVMKGRGISFLYVPEVELEVKMGLLRSLRIEEGPILVQTVIVFPRNVELSLPAREFLRLAGAME